MAGNMKLGAQLYTLRLYLQTEADIRRSLARVAAMGYRVVQLSGLGAIDPGLLRAICDENGLEVALTHNPADRILNDTDALIAEHRILGCPYVGLGGMPEKYRSPFWVDYFAEDYLPAIRRLRDAGLGFSYHNHSFEFEKHDGRTLMERLLDRFEEDELLITLDTYWLQHAGCDIYDWMERLAPRLACVHLKDYAVRGQTPEFAAVGDGNLNFARILKQLEQQGHTRYILVEQDSVPAGDDPFRCLERSYRAVAALGYAD
ncbi:MAG: sugar phosphate isomerase/epimerase [Bacillota bacterium]|nr:sugar phosphate isomerase/epimerase [Bacillota bacterium]